MSASSRLFIPALRRPLSSSPIRSLTARLAQLLQRVPRQRRDLAINVIVAHVAADLLRAQGSLTEREGN